MVGGDKTVVAYIKSGEWLEFHIDTTLSNSNAGYYLQFSYAKGSSTPTEVSAVHSIFYFYVWSTSTSTIKYDILVLRSTSSIVRR